MASQGPRNEDFVVIILAAAGPTAAVSITPALSLP
jgi:hypothetical protein